MQIADLIKDNDAEKVTTNLTTIARGGGVSFGGILFGKVGAFGVQALLGRLLGLDGYGLYSLGITIFRVFDVFANLGFTQGIVRFGSIYRGASDKKRLKGLIIGTVGISFLASITLSIIVFMSARQLSVIFSDPGLESILKIAAWILIPSTFIVMVTSFAQSQLRIDIDVRITYIFEPLAILLLSAILVGLLGWGPSGAIFALLLALVASAVVSIIQLIRLFPELIENLKPVFEIRKWLRFSIPTLLFATTFLLMRYASRLMLGYFSTSEAVGVFTSASSLSDNMSVFMQSLGVIFAPIVANLYAKKQMEELEKTFKIVNRWGITLTLPLLIVIWVFGADLLLIFGKEFQIAYSVLIILSIGQLVNVGTGPVGRVLQMVGKQDIDFLNGLVALVIDILLNLLLIPKYGALGAGLAATIALSVIHLSRLMEVYYFLHFLPYDRTFFKCTVSGLLSFFFAILFRENLMINSRLIGFVLGSGIIFASYILVLVVLGLNSDDMFVLRKIANKLGLS